MSIEVYEFKFFIRDILSIDIYKDDIKIKQLLEYLKDIPSETSLNINEIIDIIQKFEFDSFIIYNIGEYYKEQYSYSKNTRIKELLFLWNQLAKQITK